VARLVVVSNRVAPIKEGEPPSGGLAAGLLDALREAGGIWFGWSGEVTESSPSFVGSPQQVGPISLYTIPLGRADYDGYYRGFANGTLWPTLHYQLSLARFTWEDYEAWRRVNRVFALCLAPLLSDDDLIWAQDYHLFGLAEALREIGCNQRLGLFVHTPFPPPPVLMTVPPHAAVVRALAQFDVIGFQTEGDRVAFDDYLVRIAEGDIVAHGLTRAYNRLVRTEVYPIGIDVEEIAAQVVAPEYQRDAAALRSSLRGSSLILSVDRLDYSKGLRQRFLGFERFLERHPSRRGGVVMMQIAPPTREDIETYREIRRELEGEAGRINGRFAELDWVPLRYLNRGFARPSLMPMYRAARIGLVTPMRDGMNLVAKEYAAAQDPDDPGVLVLSQFAGAACELTSALLINPYDPDGVAGALEQGLSMSLEERRERHAGMLAVLRENTLARWRDRFTADLARAE